MVSIFVRSDLERLWQHTCYRSIRSGYHKHRRRTDNVVSCTRPASTVTTGIAVSDTYGEGKPFQLDALRSKS